MHSEFVDSVYTNESAAMDKAELIQQDIGEEYVVEVEPHNVSNDFLDTTKRL